MSKRLRQLMFVFGLLVYSAGLYAAEKYEFVKMWPEKEAFNSSKDYGKFIDGPNEIYITQSDHVFVFDKMKTADEDEFDGSTRIQQFSPQGDYISSWIDEDSGSNLDFEKNPVLSIGVEDILYRIGKEHCNGKSDVYIGKWISLIPLVPSSIPYSEIPLPQGFFTMLMAIDTQNDLILLGNPIRNYDTEYDANVQLDDIENTNLLFKISKSGEIIWKANVPKEVNKYSYSSLNLDKTGNIYIAADSQILKYSQRGILLKSISFDYSGYMAVDNNGNIYVTNHKNNCVIKLDAEGKEITRWGQAGSGKGEFNHPTGIGIDSKGNVYVADTDNHRVQKFAPVH